MSSLTRLMCKAFDANAGRGPNAGTYRTDRLRRLRSVDAGTMCQILTTSVARFASTTIGTSPIVSAIRRSPAVCASAHDGVALRKGYPPSRSPRYCEEK
jgi:hypothetical protein